jgi:hypothetical protein
MAANTHQHEEMEDEKPKRQRVFTPSEAELGDFSSSFPGREKQITLLTRLLAPSVVSLPLLLLYLHLLLLHFHLLIFLFTFFGQ